MGIIQERQRLILSRLVWAPSLASATERSWEVPGTDCEGPALWRECPVRRVRAELRSLHTVGTCVLELLFPFTPPSSLSTQDTFCA